MDSSHKLYIDGVDAFSEYGVYITESGYSQVLTWPSAKSVDGNDWAECDGIEEDLSEIFLDTRKIAVSLCFSASQAEFLSFFYMLNEKPIHRFSFSLIGREFNARVISTSGLEYALGLSTITITLECYESFFPLDDYGHLVAPLDKNGTLPQTQLVKLDDVNLCRYDTLVLQGLLNTAMLPASTKDNLIVRRSRMHGAGYDSEGDVKVKSFEIRLSCLTKAESMEKVMRNSDRLLYDLVHINPNAKNDDGVEDVTLSCKRTLTVGDCSLVFPCRYKSHNVSDLVLSGNHVWMYHEITLVVVGAPESLVRLLETENGVLVRKESGNYAIQI